MAQKVGGSDGCPRCGQAVYAAEKVIGAGKVRMGWMGHTPSLAAWHIKGSFTRILCTPSCSPSLPSSEPKRGPASALCHGVGMVGRPQPWGCAGGTGAAPHVDPCAPPSPQSVFIPRAQKGGVESQEPAALY